MSSSVAREAIELFNDDNDCADSETTRKSSKKLKGVNKKLKKKPVTDSKIRLSSNAYDEKWRFSTSDKTQENIKYLKAQRMFRAVDEKMAKVIFEHHQKTSRTVEKPDGKSTQSSVFTDRDFDKFEKEYVF